MDLSIFVLDIKSTLIDAAQAIQNNKHRCLLITKREKILGVISEGDLIRATLKGVSIYSPLDKFVNHSFLYIETRDLKKAFLIFKEHGISLLPIVNKDMKLIDVITISDILTSMKFK